MKNNKTPSSFPTSGAKGVKPSVRPAMGAKGENTAANQLMQFGHTGIKENTKQAGATDITSTSPDGTHVRTQAKTAKAPNVPAELSSEERRKIIAASESRGGVPFHAKVQLGGSEPKIEFRRVKNK